MSSVEVFPDNKNGASRQDIPPQEFWLHNPTTDGKIKTPLDERGLVDEKRLVAAVKETVDSSYAWPSPFNDRHHLQWPKSSYKHVHEMGVLNPAEFRSLSIGIVRVPRYFHNWIHYVTEPPPVPSDEVMQYRVDAQRVALSLFGRVKSIRRVARKMKLSGKALDDYILEQIENRHDEYMEYIDIARSQPPEFQVVNYGELAKDDPKDILVIADRVAREGIYRSIVRDVRRRAA